MTACVSFRLYLLRDALISRIQPTGNTLWYDIPCIIYLIDLMLNKQEGHDGPVSLHWLIREIHSYQTLHYLGIGLKHKTPYKD